MSDWTKVVTNPLGLAGFALFLVFAYLRVRGPKERRWLAPIAAFLAIAALTGGLVLAYLQLPKPVLTPAKTNKQTQPPQPCAAQQNSTGEGSPNIQCVQDDVTISVDQSRGKTELPKPSTEKPRQASK